MVLSRQAGHGQAEIPGLESRPALVHILTPEFTGLVPEDFTDITARDVAYAAPEQLRPSLIDVPRHGRGAVGYMSEEKHREVWLAVTPHEFRLLARHPSKLGQSALMATFDAYPEREQRTDEVQATARRSAMHAVESRQKAMAAYQEVVLGRLTLIGKFAEMQQYPNLARANLAHARSRFQTLRDDVIDNMVTAIAHQRQWTEAQATRAERTIMKRLYIEPNRLKRYTNFNAMLRLAHDYNQQKLLLMESRQKESERYLYDLGN